MLTDAVAAHSGVHFYGNLPVRWVRIVGVIVGIDDFQEKRVYTVDDSSGLNIQCVLPLEAHQEFTSKDLAPGPPIPAEYSEYDVGHVVDLRGPVVPYRCQKAIKIRRMKRVATTQHELLLWERRLKFKTEVLDVPWVLSDEEIRVYRRKAEEADAKDLSLATTKRKRRAQQEDEAGAKGTDDDPFNIRKRVSKRSGVHTHNGGHGSGEPSSGNKATTHSKPFPTSGPKEAPRACGDEPDPYSIKTGKATKPASSVPPRAAPSRRSSILDDPFKITKKGSTRALKLPVKSSMRPCVDPPPEKEHSLSGMSQAESVQAGVSSDSQKQRHPEGYDSMDGSECTNPRQDGNSIPARNPNTQRGPLASTADDPYVIKARSSRRTLITPTVAKRSASTDPFKITRSRKGPCSEKSPNAEPLSFDKEKHASTKKDLKSSYRQRGSGTRFDSEDPFKITRQARV